MIQSVLVTGGTGFVGKNMQGILPNRDWETKFVGIEDGDLRDQDVAINLVMGYDVVIHLAAKVGGIGANMAAPATFWYDNTLMAVNVLEACAVNNVQHLIVFGTACSFPCEPETIPFVEEDLWNGFPEPTNAPYGIAKRSMLAGLYGYQQERGLCWTYLIPTNQFGPCDNWDPVTSHVIPSMIRQMHEAKRTNEPLTFWSDGSASRDFLYVGDMCRIVRRLLDRIHQGTMPSGNVFNVGAGEEITMRDLAATVARVVGYTGEIRWDPSKPVGQPRRALNAEKLWNFLGGKPALTSLEEGLRRTYDWYVRSLPA